jgi:hypothetical protein
MRAVIRKTRLAMNPQRRTSKKVRGARAAKRKHRSTANPVGELIVIGAANPQRRSTHMAKKAHKKAARKRHTAARKNPFFARKAKKAARRHRTRKNPSVLGMSFKPAEILKSGLFALIGLVITRQGTQALLKQRNTGWIGYLVNIGVSAASAIAVSKFVNRAAGAAVMLGGTMYVASRVLAEKFSPIGSVLSLSGVGDPLAHGLGVIKPGYFVQPAIVDRSGKPVIPRAITDAAIAALPQPASSATPATAPVLSGTRHAGRFGVRAA